jgi:type III secretion protein T
VEIHELFGQLRPLLTTMTLCTPRLLTAFLIAPFFNTDMIGGPTRNCIVLAFALIVFPTVLPFIQTHEVSMNFIFATVIKEAAIGALIGYLAGLLFYAIGSVGHLIDHQRGASFASVMDPTIGEQISPLGSLFTQVAIILFFTSGGFLLFMSGIYESFRVWPVITYWPRFDSDFAYFFLQKVDDLMALSLLLAAPVMIALFVSELGLGLVNRFAPQLNVFFLSMPIKSAVGLLIMIFYLQFVLNFIKEGFIDRFDIFTVLRQVVH